METEPSFKSSQSPVGLKWYEIVSDSKLSTRKKKKTSKPPIKKDKNQLGSKMPLEIIKHSLLYSAKNEEACQRWDGQNQWLNNKKYR